MTALTPTNSTLPSNREDIKVLCDVINRKIQQNPLLKQALEMVARSRTSGLTEDDKAAYTQLKAKINTDPKIQELIIYANKLADVSRTLNQGNLTKNP